MFFQKILERAVQYSDGVAVVVVNWNAGIQIRDCVNSVVKHGSDCHEIVVVDNGSTDSSANFVDGISGVKIIRAGDNLGFGKACNLGAHEANSKYLLFLNPDAALYPDTLPKALAYMQAPSNADVGICGVQLLDETGHVSRSCARYATAMGFVSHSLGLDRFFPRMGHFMREWGHGEIRRVDHVIGAFFLVRRELFNELGGFDERFFVYLEDLDFSYRAHLAGWSSVYLAEAQAFHAGGGTSNQVKARRLFYSLRSRLLYAHKHFSWFGTAAVLFSTLFIEPLSRSFWAVARGSWPSLRETWSAYGMLWRWLPQWVFRGATR